MTRRDMTEITQEWHSVKRENIQLLFTFSFFFLTKKVIVVTVSSFKVTTLFTRLITILIVKGCCEYQDFRLAQKEKNRASTYFS